VTFADAQEADPQKAAGGTLTCGQGESYRRIELSAIERAGIIEDCLHHQIGFATNIGYL
jgi:hypothetical protein